MRTLDISGLVSLHKYFSRGAQMAPWMTFTAAVFAFMPEVRDRALLGVVTVLSAAAWFVLSKGRFAASQYVVPTLAAVILLAIWRHWTTPDTEMSREESAVMFLLPILLYVPLQGAFGLWLPSCRVASRSPHARALFDSGSSESWPTRMRRRLRGLRLVPVLVVLLILAALVAGAYMMSGQPREQAQSTKRGVQSIVATLGGAALLWARRRFARRGATVRAADTRPPVLLLRSFGDDMLKIEKGARWTRPNDLARQGMTFERVVVGQLEPFGPVVAIGKPGEALAPLGAARDYVSDDVWQREVEQRIHEASLIVLMLGRTEGLAWELLRVQRLDQLRKLIMLFPPAADLEQRWLTLRTRDVLAGKSLLPDLPDPTRILALVWNAKGQSVALEAPRTEWAYEAAIRIAADLVVHGQRLEVMG